MSKMNGETASQRAIDLIEQQLQMLPLAIEAILQPAKAGDIDPGLVTKILHKKPRTNKTGSGGNIAATYAEADPILDFRAANQALHDNPQQRMQYLRLVISNSLLAVGSYLKKHDMSSMRTPEVQFLGHICDAILNENTFDLEPGYMPIATFDGLVIDGKLNGTPLFGDGTHEGLMEFGDAIALLRWFSRYLRGEKNFVSGGDAG